MSNKPVIIFDFDGTISDSVGVIFHILNQISNKYGFRKILKPDLNKYRKLGTETLIRELRIPKEHVSIIIDEINNGLTKNANKIKPVEGMVEVIQSLTLAGYHLNILTTNTMENVVNFLKKYDIASFQYIYTLAGLYGKGELLKKLIDELEVTANNVVYIGDETRDIEAGKNSRVKTIGVTWGLNVRESLMQKNPDWVVDNPGQLLEIFK